MNTKQRLRSEADKLWFDKCLGLFCQACDWKTANQVHHFYYKSSYGHLRYEEDNAISLCQACHFLLHHQDPKKIEEQIIARRGIKWYNKLKKKSQEKPKLSYQTIKYYTDIIKKLEKLC